MIKIFDQKTFFVQKKNPKNFGSKKLVEIVFFCPKTFRSKIVLDPNKFKVQKLFGTKNVWFNAIGSEFFLP